MGVSHGWPARTFHVTSRTRLLAPAVTRHPAPGTRHTKGLLDATASPARRRAPGKLRCRLSPERVTSAGGPSPHLACHGGARPLFRCLGSDTVLLVTQRTRHHTYVPA